MVDYSSRVVPPDATWGSRGFFRFYPVPPTLLKL